MRTIARAFADEESSSQIRGARLRTRDKDGYAEYIVHWEVEFNGGTYFENGLYTRDKAKALADFNRRVAEVA